MPLASRAREGLLRKDSEESKSMQIPERKRNRTSRRTESRETLVRTMLVRLCSPVIENTNEEIGNGENSETKAICIIVVTEPFTLTRASIFKKLGVYVRRVPPGVHYDYLLCGAPH
jgi:hypothetical protein